MTPLGDHVLVKLEEETEKKVGSLYVAQMTNDPLTRAQVVAVGDGEISQYTGSRTPLDVKAGEWVWFHTYAGAEVLIGGEKHKLLRQSDLVAKDD